MLFGGVEALLLSVTNLLKSIVFLNDRLQRFIFNHYRAVGYVWGFDDFRKSIICWPIGDQILTPGTHLIVSNIKKKWKIKITNS